MYALVQYHIDSTTAILECGEIEAFKPRNVADFDTSATYRAYWCGDSDTLGGYYDATVHHLAGKFIYCWLDFCWAYDIQKLNILL